MKRQLQYILDKLEEEESEEVWTMKRTTTEEVQEAEEDNLSGVLELYTMLKGEALLLSLFAAQNGQPSTGGHLPDLFHKATSANTRSMSSASSDPWTYK